MTHPFPCTRCGACCVAASPLLGALGLVPLDPVSDLCAHLNGVLGSETRCAVYDDRPALCNLDRVHAFLGSDETAFVRATAAGCNALQLQLGLAETFRVVVEPQ